MKIQIILTLALLAMSLRARAGEQILSESKVEAPADVCANGRCDFKSAGFVVYKKRVRLSSDTQDGSGEWFTDTRFHYEVKSPSEIETYAIVQWIRGCMFSSRIEHGRELHELTIDRPYFGGDAVFRHPHWQIDSDSTDPIYTSEPDLGRFGLLRWNRDPESFDPETATWYSHAKPPHGSVFATDLPGAAFASFDSENRILNADNATLEFRTCLYRTADLPKSTTPDGAGIELQKALWCATWDHRFVWDFSTHQMASPSGFDSICAMDPTP